MRFAIISILCFLCAGKLMAQSEEDKVVFKAMTDEMERSQKELVIPGSDPAFFISYDGTWGKFIMMRAVQGALVASEVRDNYTQGGIRLLCGDYQNTNLFFFGSGRYQGVRLIGEKDYDAIRHSFWQGTDGAYKVAQHDIIMKKNLESKLNLTDAEKALPEFEKVAPITKIIAPTHPYTFDEAYWENYIKEVSAYLAQNKDIFNTGVYLHGVDLDMYTKTTEGTTLKQPFRYFTLRVGGVVRAADGMEYADSFVETTECPQDMPKIENIKKQVDEMVARLSALAKAPVMDEEYTGPIMFEGEVMQYFFVGNLYGSVGNPFLASRRDEDGKAKEMAMPEEKIGKEITNKQLTVKNYTRMKEYKGMSLMGSYEVDAEGVVPEAEMTLIENGVLKQVLNRRSPTLKAPKSTGSFRYAMQQEPTIAPGALHIQAKGGKSPAELKKMLIKTAKKKGLDHAYIVRKRMAPLPLTYRVDVKTGEETLVRSVTKLDESWRHLKGALAFSKEELVLNCVPFGIPAALIYPSAVLIDNLYIAKIRQAPVPEPALTRPALR